MNDISPQRRINQNPTSPLNACLHRSVNEIDGHISPQRFLASIGGRSNRVNKKDKKVAKGALKLKKVKSMERGHSDHLMEVYRNSDSKDNPKIMKEDKRIKRENGGKRHKLYSKKKKKEGIDFVANNEDPLSCKYVHKVKGMDSGRIASNGLSNKSIHEECMNANIGTEKKSEKKNKNGKRKRKEIHAAKESKMEESQSEVDAENVDQISLVDENCSRRMKKKSRKDGYSKKKDIYIAKERKTDEMQVIADKVNQISSVDNDCSRVMERQADAEKVDQISLVDDDCSRGMKKWLIQYRESQPGLKILQQRIDDFMTAYDARQEQEKKERAELAAGGGWTVVMHHKGRKKTTDPESGIAVGSVAQAAVMDKLAKKKSKDVGLNFYRFQKRDAQRNEVMMLQSKFEQERKKRQQLRAARNFRPC